MFNIDFIIVSIVLLFIIISLYKELIGPAFTFLIGVIALGIFGILTPSEILAGFGNEQVVVIILLLLIGDIINKTAILEILFDKLFKNAKSYKSFLSKMMLLTGSFSAFLNNTPIVTLMMPYVLNWSKKNNFNPSKLLIPLSYITILGGCITLIGTSTNLIVNGLIAEQNIIVGMKPLKLFDFSTVGIPMFIIGFIYLYLFSNKLLPERKNIIDEINSSSREYFVEVYVEDNSKVIGKTIEEANLRNLDGLFLIEIVRNSHIISAVSPNEIIEKNDLMIFAGETEKIADMVNSNNGLKLSEVGMFAKKSHTKIIEIVVSYNSSLINKTVKEASFRGRYNAAILAVHRNGERVPGKIGNVKLKAGDLLLLIVGTDFEKRIINEHDFYLVSKIKDIHRMENYKIATIIIGVFLAVVLSSLGFISLFMALIILIIIFLAMNIASPKDLPKSIDYNLAIIIVLSLALGTAIIKSGFAELISDVFVNFAKPYGIIAILSMIFLVSTVLTSFISNAAVAAIIFPIAITIASDLNIDPTPFALLVAFGAGTSFSTPIGYQTNLIVYGPGGYKYKDYFVIGAPLTILYLLVTVFVLAWQFNLL